jgi:hypothetical protein
MEWILSDEQRKILNILKSDNKTPRKRNPTTNPSSNNQNDEENKNNGNPAGDQSTLEDSNQPTAFVTLTPTKKPKIENINSSPASSTSSKLANITSCSTIRECKFSNNLINNINIYISHWSMLQ